jgi:transposase
MARLAQPRNSIKPALQLKTSWFVHCKRGSQKGSSMVRFLELEDQILSFYEADKLRMGTIARRLGIHHCVVQRVLAQAGLLIPGTSSRPATIDLYLPIIRQTLETFPTLPASRVHKILLGHGYTGSSGHLRHVVACLRAPFDGFEWMLSLLQKKIGTKELKSHTGALPDLGMLLSRLYGGGRFDRNKSLVILGNAKGLSMKLVCGVLGISETTFRDYKRKYLAGGAEALFSRTAYLTRRRDGEDLKSAIFKLLHEPPSNYGINRTTWTMALFKKVLRETGNGACPDVIRRITRDAGYRWRKARVVLTSADPAYSEKLERIQSILSGLKPDEMFFSIDEYGPFAIKMRGGLKLVATGEQNTVPQWQRSRGSIILTGALELSSNQVTYFFSNKKNTAEMIKMMDVLVAKYADRRKLYLSWDAASWHISKQLNMRITAHNEAAVENGGVVVEAAPLPSGAQFLNVIESVFSGMSKAIIHNSNYPTVEDAKMAITRYFNDRNDFFKSSPRRAGKKIWGKEREPATFSDSSNCKDPRYR